MVGVRELFACYGTVRSWMEARAYRPNASVGDQRLTRWALGLFLADIVFMIRGYAVSNIVETLLFATFLVYPPLRRELVKSLRDPMVFILMVFFAWTLLSGLWSSASIAVIVDDWWGWRKLLLLPIGLVLLSTERRAIIAFYTLSGMGLVYVAVVVVDFAGFGQLWQRPYNRVVQDQNVQGLYFSLMGLACALYAGVYRDKRSLALFFAALGFVYFTFVAWHGASRSGYVAFVISLSLAGSYLLRAHWLGLLVGGLLAIGVLWQSPLVNQRVEQAVSELAIGAADSGGQDTSGSIRFVMWENTLKMIQSAPLLGSGAGDFKKAYADVVAGQTGWRSTITDDPHNQYLHIWGEYGVMGLLLFLSFLTAIFFRIHWGSVEGILLASTLLTSVTVSMFNGVYGAAAMGRFVLISLTICLALSWFRHVSMGVNRGD